MCKLTQNILQLLNLEIIAYVGPGESKHEGMLLPAKHPQVLGWHFVNYICYLIDLVFMTRQCWAGGLAGLGVQFHAKSELQPKVLPAALCQG